MARRRAEIERGVTLVGPHRDDWKLTIDGLDARTQASQGEQRTLALALRLAGRGVVHELTGTPPVLLLDDVFSELDARRSSALVRNLPSGQTLLTTAGVIPADVEPDRVLRIARSEETGGVSPRGVTTNRDEPVARGDSVAAVGRELGMPAPDAFATLAGRGRRSSARRSSRTPRSARSATACARSRSTDPVGRPSCGTPNARSWSARSGVADPVS